MRPPITDHNLLQNLQGGQSPDERYHFTEDQHQWLEDGYNDGYWDATKGGTGITSYSTGDIIYADGVDELTVLNAGSDGYVLTLSGGVPVWDDNASGNVVGPSSATDNEIVSFDGTSGKIIQGSSILTDGYGNITSVGSVDFNSIDPSTVSHVEGRVFYDDDDKTLSIMTDFVGTKLQVGQELYIRALNVTGTDIPDGYVVYIDSAQSDRPTVALANANLGATSYVIGVATNAIPNNQEGIVTSFGLVRGINTNAWSDGTQLYLSTVDGQLSDAPPSGADTVVLVATVINQDSVNGILLVDVKTPGKVGIEYPYGFENHTDSEILFDDITRTFTIQPKSLPSPFVYWSNSSRYIKDFSDSVVIPDTIGTHYFYYDGYTLSTTIVPPDFNVCWVASVLWDGNEAVGLSDERHMIFMDWATHKYLHESIGAKYVSGLIGTQLSVGTGSSTTDAQFSISDGIIFDEDILINIVRSANPVNEFEQELGLTNIIPGEFPVYYQDGYDAWRKFTTTTFPMMPYDGYGGGGRIGYNTNIDGYWTVEDPGTNGDRVAYWFVATNNIAEPVICIMGVNADRTFEEADDSNSLSNTLLYIIASASVLPFREMAILYRLIVRTSLAYGNGIHAYIEDVKDYRDAPITVLSHAGLGDRDDQNQHPATAIAVDTSGFNEILSAADTDVQKSLDTIDDHVQSALKGGTGFTTYTTGDIIYANGVNSLAKLPVGSNGEHLIVASGVPAWDPFSIFGEDYQYAESSSRSTTTSTVYQTKLTLTTSPLNGTYLVSWSAVVDQSSVTESVGARLRNVTDSDTIAGLAIHEPKDNDNRIHVGGFEQVVFTGPAKVFEIQYRVVGIATAGIKNATIAIWKVS